MTPLDLDRTETPVVHDRPTRSRRQRAIGEFHRRLDAQPGWILIVQLFFGIGWLRAASEKIVSVAWWNGRTLDQFLAMTADERLPWLQWLIDDIARANTFAVGAVVLVCQISAGVLLVSGRRASVGMTLGIAMSVVFVASGAVNPGVFYVIGHLVILLWMVDDAMSPPHARIVLRTLRIAAIAIAAMSAPFVSTIDPGAVVDDAPAVLVVVGVLLATASTASLRQLRNEPGAALSDVPPAGRDEYVVASR